MKSNTPAGYRHGFIIKHEKELWSFDVDPIDDPLRDMATAPDSPDSPGAAGISPLASVASVSDAKIPVTKPPTSKCKASPEFRSPWRVYSLLDVWHFFGPLLSLIVITQVCSSILISIRLNASILISSTSVAAMILAVFLATDTFILFMLRGRHFRSFTPWLTGLLLVSLYIALVTWRLNGISSQ